MPGTLFVVATPIGNLEDVTLRALRVLREVSLIAAEDTRRTARLLQHYSIPTPTTSFHEYNERSKAPRLIERIRNGASIALVSDAGTPVLSDPGAVLVRLAHEAGIKVEPVPGPSAAVAAVSASGVQSEGFIFAGFPPSRPNARKKWLSSLALERRAIVIYEAPHRIRALLADLAEIFGDRLITLGRELTKAHEELVVRPISAVLETLVEPRGEYTLVIHPGGTAAATPDSQPEPNVIVREFGDMTNNGVPRRQAVKSLAKKYGRPSRELYAMLLKPDGNSV
jgi:16S rRNA (cytidine1402-2'-O)-methyltransferase